MPFIGMYGNEFTWREMQTFCNHYAAPQHRSRNVTQVPQRVLQARSNNKNEQSDSANDKETTHPA